MTRRPEKPSHDAAEQNEVDEEDEASADERQPLLPTVREWEAKPSHTSSSSMTKETRHTWWGRDKLDAVKQAKLERSLRSEDPAKHNQRLCAQVLPHRIRVPLFFDMIRDGRVRIRLLSVLVVVLCFATFFDVLWGDRWKDPVWQLGDSQPTYLQVGVQPSAYALLTEAFPTQPRAQVTNKRLQPIPHLSTTVTLRSLTLYGSDLLPELAGFQCVTGSRQGQQETGLLALTLQPLCQVQLQNASAFTDRYGWAHFAGLAVRQGPPGMYEFEFSVGSAQGVALSATLVQLRSGVRSLEVLSAATTSKIDSWSQSSRSENDDGLHRDDAHGVGAEKRSGDENRLHRDDDHGVGAERRAHHQDEQDDEAHGVGAEKRADYASALPAPLRLTSPLAPPQPWTVRQPRSVSVRIQLLNFTATESSVSSACSDPASDSSFGSPFASCDPTFVASSPAEQQLAGHTVVAFAYPFQLDPSATYQPLRTRAFWSGDVRTPKAAVLSGNVAVTNEQGVAHFPQLSVQAFNAPLQTVLFSCEGVLASLSGGGSPLELLSPLRETRVSVPPPDRVQEGSPFSLSAVVIDEAGRPLSDVPAFLEIISVNGQPLPISQAWSTLAKTLLNPLSSPSDENGTLVFDEVTFSVGGAVGVYTLVVVADGVRSAAYDVEVTSIVNIVYADWWTANEPELQPLLTVRQPVDFGPTVLVLDQAQAPIAGKRASIQVSPVDSIQLAYEVLPSNEDGMIQFTNVQVMYAREDVPSFDLFFLVDGITSNQLTIEVEPIYLPPSITYGNQTISNFCGYLKVISAPDQMLVGKETSFAVEAFDFDGAPLANQTLIVAILNQPELDSLKYSTSDMTAITDGNGVALFDQFQIHSGLNGTLELIFESVLGYGPPTSSSPSSHCQSEVIFVPVLNLRYDLQAQEVVLDQVPGFPSTLTYTIHGLNSTPLTSSDVLVQLLLAPPDYMGQLDISSEHLVETGTPRIVSLSPDHASVEIDVLIVQLFPGAFQFGCRIAGLEAPVVNVWLQNEVDQLIVEQLPSGTTSVGFALLPEPLARFVSASSDALSGYHAAAFECSLDLDLVYMGSLADRLLTPYSLPSDMNGMVTWNSFGVASAASGVYDLCLGYVWFANRNDPLEPSFQPASLSPELSNLTTDPIVVDQDLNLEMVQQPSLHAVVGTPLSRDAQLSVHTSPFSLLQRPIVSVRALGSPSGLAQASFGLLGPLERSPIFGVLPVVGIGDQGVVSFGTEDSNPVEFLRGMPGVYHLEFSIPGGSTVQSRPILLEYTALSLEIVELPNIDDAVVIGVPFRVSVQALLNGQPIPNTYVRAHAQGLSQSSSVAITDSEGVAQFSLLFDKIYDEFDVVVHFKIPGRLFGSTRLIVTGYNRVHVVNITTPPIGLWEPPFLLYPLNFLQPDREASALVSNDLTADIASLRQPTVRALDRYGEPIPYQMVSTFAEMVGRFFRADATPGRTNASGEFTFKDLHFTDGTSKGVTELVFDVSGLTVKSDDLHVFNFADPPLPTFSFDPRYLALVMAACLVPIFFVNSLWVNTGLVLVIAFGIGAAIVLTLMVVNLFSLIFSIVMYTLDPFAFAWKAMYLLILTATLIPILATVYVYFRNRHQLFFENRRLHVYQDHVRNLLSPTFELKFDFEVSLPVRVLYGVEAAYIWIWRRLCICSHCQARTNRYAHRVHRRDLREQRRGRFDDEIQPSLNHSTADLPSGSSGSGGISADSNNAKGDVFLMETPASDEFLSDEDHETRYDEGSGLKQRSWSSASASVPVSASASASASSSDSLAGHGHGLDHLSSSEEDTLMRLNLIRQAPPRPHTSRRRHPPHLTSAGAEMRRWCCPVERHDIYRRWPDWFYPQRFLLAFLLSMFFLFVCILFSTLLLSELWVDLELGQSYTVVFTGLLSNLIRALIGNSPALQPLYSEFVDRGVFWFFEAVAGFFAVIQARLYWCGVLACVVASLTVVALWAFNLGEYKRQIMEMRQGRIGIEPENFHIGEGSRYPGIQAAHCVIGYFVVFFILWIVSFIFSFGFVRVLAWKLAIDLLALVVTIQLFLSLFRSTITNYVLTSVFAIRYPRWFALWDWVNTYIEIITGISTAFGRLLLAFGSMLVTFPRLDTPLMGWAFLQGWDPGYASFISMVYADHLYNDPVVNVFCSLLLQLHERRRLARRRQRKRLKRALAGGASYDELETSPSAASQLFPDRTAVLVEEDSDCEENVSFAAAYDTDEEVEAEVAEQEVHGTTLGRELRLRRRRARLRWLVAYTLICNPSIRSTRRIGGKRPYAGRYYECFSSSSSEAE